MAEKKTSYVSRPVDQNGYAQYTDEENQIWHDLMIQQMDILKNRACDEYMHGLSLLQLPNDRIPQCPDVTKVLKEMTGWSLAPVPALIPFDRFFNLLANKKFPAATFIRRREELLYLQEPDIFHEVFGHCPLLTHPAYADFTHLYGQLGQKANHDDRVMLAKLYWFTIEFGLIQTKEGLRIYGGGILSSMSETPYCLESVDAIRKPFDPIDILRTPYRIDQIQPIYYVIDDFNVLFNLVNMDLMALIKKARSLGMHEPLYSEETT